MAQYLHEFLESRNGDKKDNDWWLIEDDRLINFKGGWHGYTPRLTDIIVEANSFEELDWSCLIKNSYSTGWLDLNGIFYGCDTTEHELIAGFYFKSNSRELEKIGFIKIYLSYNNGLAWYCEKKYPTKKQEDYLLEQNLIKAEERI